MSEQGLAPAPKPARVVSPIPWLRCLLAALALSLLFFLSAGSRASWSKRGQAVVEAPVGLLSEAPSGEEREPLAHERDPKDLAETVAAYWYVLSRRPFDKAHTVLEAEVLMRDPYEGYWTGDLVISRGSTGGVVVGMAVESLQGMVIGRIVATAAGNSVVRLICNLSIPVRVESRSLSGITTAQPASSGSRGGRAAREVAMLMPQPTQCISGLQGPLQAMHEGSERQPKFLQAGDRVVTSRAAYFAAGLFVGVISDSAPVVRSALGFPLRAGLVTGDLHNLRFVRVIVPSPLPKVPSPIQ